MSLTVSQNEKGAQLRRCTCSYKDTIAWKAAFREGKIHWSSHLPPPPTHDNLLLTAKVVVLLMTH